MTWGKEWREEEEGAKRAERRLWGCFPADPGSGGSSSTTVTTSGGCQVPMRPKAIVVPKMWSFVEGELQRR